MRIIGIILILMLAVPNAFANLYVIYDKDTNEVFTISPKDDTVVPENHEKAVIPGGWENYEFDERPTDYKFKNNKFIKNIEKIDKKEKEKEDKVKKELELEVIEKHLRDKAIEELKLEGFIFEHY